MLIDEALLIELLNGNVEVLDWLLSRQDLCISVLTQASIQAQCRSWERLQIQTWLEGFRRLPVDAEIAAAAADLCNQSDLPLHDALLLATARRHGLQLATRRCKRFPLSFGDVIHACSAPATDHDEPRRIVTD